MNDTSRRSSLIPKDLSAYPASNSTGTATSTSTPTSTGTATPTSTATGTGTATPTLPPPLPPTPHATPTATPSLPHHRLVAYTVALELLAAVRAASIRDATLRDQALRAAKSACLNAAEGAGRVTRADKARSFAIARAEAGEAAAAVEIAASVGDATASSAAEVNRLAHRVVALLTGLIR